jgi:hypothetical protein
MIPNEVCGLTKRSGKETDEGCLLKIKTVFLQDHMSDLKKKTILK